LSRGGFAFKRLFNMARSDHNKWLHRFAVLTAIATLALIGIGGLVTSHEAGMSVPDWPTSYGYNMFLLPLSKWWHQGNVFYEHSHRLFASGVGLLTTILMVWLWTKESRTLLRWLGVVAFFAVVAQGVLGGLRVVMFKDQIGIFHGTLAQLFFVLICAIALFTSKWWKNIEQRTASNERPVISRGFFLFATLLIFGQLMLGATMRHQHAGLAIPDFPLAYGKIWPLMDEQSVARYNQQRQEVTETHPITAAQIALQMAHRIVALLILVSVGTCAVVTSRRLGIQNVVSRLAIGWLGLILLQATLGALTILKNKPADIATAHVLIGALSLMTGSMLVLIAFRVSAVSSKTKTSVSPFPFALGQTAAPNVE
jgi:heme a synthase